MTCMNDMRLADRDSKTMSENIIVATCPSSCCSLTYVCRTIHADAAGPPPRLAGISIHASNTYVRRNTGRQNGWIKPMHYCIFFPPHKDGPAVVICSAVLLFSNVHAWHGRHGFISLSPH